MTRVVAAAPAKLNLYLHVVGRRADGYHLLDSLIAFADIGDRLEAEAADELTLAVDGPFAEALADAKDNLVLGAARLLAEAVGRQPAARLRLTKRLPVAAGLGGGSADAAAALQALMRLWGIRRGAVDLAALGLKLGADVPVCLAGGVRSVSGIGEVIERAPPLPPVGLVLVNPRRGLATQSVFKRFNGTFSKPAPLTHAAADAPTLAAALKQRRNDLTEAALAEMPEIARMLEALEANPDCLLARMSGSGATVFGLYADPATAKRGAALVAAGAPGWWVAAGRFRRR